jgi:predicted nucleotidyltransferase
MLIHRFADFQLNLTLESFVNLVVDFFGERLVSMVLYGSIVFDDLAPGYGDLDFLVVVEGDLAEATCEQLAEFRKPLRGGEYGAVGKMLEGAFLPRRMLNPTLAGRACWWGTSGERVWQSNELGWLTLYVIREHGIVIWGEDIRCEIPVVEREQLLDGVCRTCRTMEEHSTGGTLHSIDWLLTAARTLLFLKEGRLSSKSEAADWAHRHAEGDWREWLSRAKQLRLNPSLADSAGWRHWLDGLAVPIGEACEELRQELMRQSAAE